MACESAAFQRRALTDRSSVFVAASNVRQIMPRSLVIYSNITLEPAPRIGVGIPKSLQLLGVACGKQNKKSQSEHPALEDQADHKE